MENNSTIFITFDDFSSYYDLFDSSLFEEIENECSQIFSALKYYTPSDDIVLKILSFNEE